MALEDYMESEVAVAVAVTAAVFSPRVRSVARRGAVLGVAGAIKAADAVSAAARGVANEAQSVTTSDGAAAQPAPEEPAAPRTQSRRRTPAA
jgi:hypothetical protein